MSDDSLVTNSPAEGHSIHTKDRILDTAERLFAEYGLQKVSTREITHAASANVGAINYYFGGKEGLVEAVFNRRLTPLNQKRFAALEALEKGAVPPSAEAILEVLIRPAMEQCSAREPGTAHFGRLMGRVLGETGECIEKLKTAHFIPLVNRFQEALQRAIPGMPREDLHWRIIFTFGAMHYTLLAMNQSLPPWLEDRPSIETQITRLVDFASRGLRTS